MCKMSLVNCPLGTAEFCQSEMFSTTSRIAKFQLDRMTGSWLNSRLKICPVPYIHAYIHTYKSEVNIDGFKKIQIK